MYLQGSKTKKKSQSYERVGTLSIHSRYYIVSIPDLILEKMVAQTEQRQYYIEYVLTYKLSNTICMATKRSVTRH